MRCYRDSDRQTNHFESFSKNVILQIVKISITTKKPKFTYCSKHLQFIVIFKAHRPVKIVC